MMEMIIILMNNYLSGIPELLLVKVDPHLRYCIFTFLTCILLVGWSTWI